jgi:hypothetical protein
MHNDTAANMARVIAELDALVNRAASGDAPADVWAELRDLRTRALLAFERMTGRTVERGIGRRS